MTVIVRTVGDNKDQKRKPISKELITALCVVQQLLPPDISLLVLHGQFLPSSAYLTFLRSGRVSHFFVFELYLAEELNSSVFPRQKELLCLCILLLPEVTQSAFSGLPGFSVTTGLNGQFCGHLCGRSLGPTCLMSFSVSECSHCPENLPLCIIGSLFIINIFHLTFCRPCPVAAPALFCWLSAGRQSGPYNQLAEGTSLHLLPWLRAR